MSRQPSGGSSRPMPSISGGSNDRPILTSRESTFSRLPNVPVGSQPVHSQPGSSLQHAEQQRGSMISQSASYSRVSVQDLLNEESTAPLRPSQPHLQREGIICHAEGCGRHFVSQESLIAHQRRSHAAPTAFVCQLCNLSYSTVPNLNKHVWHPHNFPGSSV